MEHNGSTTNDRPEPWREGMVGTTHACLFLAGSGVWLILIGVLTVVVVSMRLGGPPAEEDAYIVAMGPIGLGLMTLVQMAGFTAITLGSVSILPKRGSGRLWDRPGVSDLSTRIGQMLALRAAPLPLLISALAGGLTVWLFPGWIFHNLKLQWPDHNSSVELVSEMLRTGPLLERLPLLLAVVIGAPIVEELMFRGFLWECLERGSSSLVALVGTTLLFAAYHIDFMHVVSLLPTACFLGWLRWVSGSLYAPILGHFMNNAIATTVALFFEGDASGAPTIAPSFAGLAWTVSACGIGWMWALHAQKST